MPHYTRIMIKNSTTPPKAKYMPFLNTEVLGKNIQKVEITKKDEMNSILCYAFSEGLKLINEGARFCILLQRKEKE